MSQNLELIKSQKNELVGLMRLAIPNMSVEQATIAAMQELSHLDYISIFKPEILECHPQTIAHAVRNSVKNGLSLDPDAGMVYITTRNNKVGGGVIKSLEVQPSVNGMIYQQKLAGNIADIESSVEYDDVGYVVSVTITLIKIVGSDRKRETFKFTNNDFKQWEFYSHRQNAYGKSTANQNTLDCANANYSNYYPDKPNKPHNYLDKGGINPGFAITKCIRHAIRRAKMPFNIASRRLDVSYEQVVSSEFDEVATQEADFEVIKDDAVQHQQTQQEQPKPVAEQPKPTQVAESPNAVISDATKQINIINTEILACTKPEEIMKIFNDTAKRAVITASPELLALIKKRKSELDSLATKKEITANDL